MYRQSERTCASIHDVFGKFDHSQWNCYTKQLKVITSNTVLIINLVHKMEHTDT